MQIRAIPPSPSTHGETLGALELRDPATVERIAKGFRSAYLSDSPPLWLESPEGKAEVEREVSGKYNQCVRHVLPWTLSTGVDLGRCTIAEVGCGTGSKAAAFAKLAGKYIGCDYSLQHLRAAEHRARVMGLTNAEFHHQPNGQFLEMLERLKIRVDVVLLYAVLEHMTLDERLDTLSRAWRMLPEGGLLVVAETPNRLLPWDFHTSGLPFFNMLPDELALQYSARSSRKDLVAKIAGSGPEKADTLLSLRREGRGVSYHEFELALGETGPLSDLVAADGMHVDMLNLDAMNRDEVELCQFVSRERLRIPPAFLRYWLTAVLQKGGARSKRGDLHLLHTERGDGGTREDAGVLTSRSSSLGEFAVPPNCRELVVGLRAPSCDSRVVVQDEAATTLATYSLRSRWPKHWHDHKYFRVDIPSATRAVRLTVVQDRPDDWVLLTHVHCR